MYRLNFHSYCGMSFDYGTFDDKAEARQEAAQILKERRAEGFPVTTLERGEQWEVMEPDDCMMVPDDCGLLVLRHVTFECRECGQQWEDKEERAYCCSEQERWDMLEREEMEETA